MVSPRIANARSSTLLLIEEEPSSTEAIYKALDLLDAKFELESVQKLSLGLERLRTQPFAAVLIDLFGAGGGLQAIAELRAVAPDVPILVLSAPGQEAQAREAVHHGARDYLLKSELNADSLSWALYHLSEHESPETALFFDRARAEATLNSIGDAVLSIDLSGTVVYLNAVAERMTGWARADAIGQALTTVFRIVDGTTRAQTPNPLVMAIELDRTVGLTPNCVLIAKDGHETAIEDSAAPMRDRRGRLTGAVIVFRDVTATRAMTQQLSHRAHHDVLTDLPNRLLLNDRLGGAMASARRHGTRVAVLYLDVDRFKHVNDSLGHTIGDQLLRSVAERAKACLRDADTVSRLGGDEFVILLPDVTDAHDVGACATKLLAAVAAPQRIEDREVRITASVGISLYPDDGDDPDSLIQAADTAMYCAKRQGGGRYELSQYPVASADSGQQALATDGRPSYALRPDSTR